MFGVGEFASNISIFKAQQKKIERIQLAKREEMLKTIELLLDTIDSENPNYFNSFKEKIKTKKHNDILLAIKEGGKYIERSLKAVVPRYRTFHENMKSDIASKKDYFKTVEDVNNYVNSFESDNYELLHENIIASHRASPCALAIACVVYFVVAVHNTLALAANVYLVFALWGPGLDSASLELSSDDVLKQEMLVQEIVNVKW